MASVIKKIGGTECECFEFIDPATGPTGKMRMMLGGTFGENINCESVILVPMSLSEAELDIIGDLWLTAQEKELGLPIGESCSSSGWWVGSSDGSRDKDITEKYDFLVPLVLSNQEAHARLKSEIDTLYKEQAKLNEELDAEYADGETDWSAQLEVKIEDIERLISDREDLLTKSRLLTIGNKVDYDGYFCEVIHLENNVVYLQDNNSDWHFEVSVSSYLGSDASLIEGSPFVKPSLDSQIHSAAFRAAKSDVGEKSLLKSIEAEL